jgi:hypothetical protein
MSEQGTVAPEGWESVKSGGADNQRPQRGTSEPIAQPASPYSPKKGDRK